MTNLPYNSILPVKATMASRSNPNTPASQKRKAAASIRKKRKYTKHLVSVSKRTDADGAVKRVPRTSQALRKANAVQRKKLRDTERRARREEKDAMRRGTKMEVEEEVGEGFKDGEVQKKDAGMDID